MSPGMSTWNWAVLLCANCNTPAWTFVPVRQATVGAAEDGRAHQVVAVELLQVAALRVTTSGKSTQPGLAELPATRSCFAVPAVTYVKGALALVPTATKPFAPKDTLVGLLPVPPQFTESAPGLWSTKSVPS